MMGGEILPLFMAEQVKLMWVTPEAEHLITDMARVSAPKNQGNYDTAPRLIKYLIKHRHWSPFEMASMCVEINTTRDIAAQIIRHRSFSFQEFSQRYADVKDLGTIAVPELRRQDTKNRQNSVADLDPELVRAFEQRIRMLFSESQELYDDMLEAGVAKESARKVLPMNSPSRIYMTGTLRSWMHYIDLRSAHGTQKEHKDIAWDIADIFAEQFPAIYQALEEIKGEPEKPSSAEHKVPEGFILVPTPRTQQKRRRERLREVRNAVSKWIDKNIFDI